MFVVVSFRPIMQILQGLEILRYISYNMSLYKPFTVDLYKYEVLHRISIIVKFGTNYSDAIRIKYYGWISEIKTPQEKL